MRTAEVLVLSHETELLDEFRHGLQGEVQQHLSGFWSLLYPLDSDYSLLFYGIHLEPGDEPGTWGWLATSALGLIYLQRAGQAVLDSPVEQFFSALEKQLDLPVVVALRLEDSQDGPPLQAYRGGLLIADGVRFEIYDGNNPANLRHLIVDLINTNLERMPSEVS